MTWKEAEPRVSAVLHVLVLVLVMFYVLMLSTILQPPASNQGAEYEASVNPAGESALVLAVAE